MSVLFSAKAELDNKAIQAIEQNSLKVSNAVLGQDISTNIPVVSNPVGQVIIIMESDIYIKPKVNFPDKFLGAAVFDSEDNSKIISMASYPVSIVDKNSQELSTIYLSSNIKAVTDCFGLDENSLKTAAINPQFIPKNNLMLQGNWQDDPLFKKYKAKLEVSPFGSELISLLEKHQDEVSNLVNQNKTVTVVWHNNNGPEFAKQYSDIVQNDQRQEYPKKIGNVTLEMLVSNMTMALHQEGSQSLKEDIQKYSVKILSNIQNISQKANTLDEVINEINKISPVMVSSNFKVPIPDQKGISGGDEFIIPGGCILDIQSGSAILDLIKQSLSNIDTFDLNNINFNDFTSGTCTVFWKSLAINGVWIAHQGCISSNKKTYTKNYTGIFSSNINKINAKVSFDFSKGGVTKFRVDTMPDLTIYVCADGATKDINDWINSTINSDLIIKTFKSQILQVINSTDIIKIINKELSGII